MIKRLKKQMQIQFMSQYLTLFIILLQKSFIAGKNVICEKPFTVKYDEFKKLKQSGSYVDRLRNVYDEKIEADPKDQEMYENMRNRMDMMRRCRHMGMEMPFGMMHHMCGRAVVIMVTIMMILVVAANDKQNLILSISFEQNMMDIK